MVSKNEFLYNLEEVMYIFLKKIQVRFENSHIASPAVFFQIRIILLGHRMIS